MINNSNKDLKTQMAEFKLGRIRFVWKGAWAAAYLIL